MSIDYDRISSILIPLEGEDIAYQARDAIQAIKEGQVAPISIVNKLVDRLVIKHDIQGDDKDFLESLKE
jgi:hypothetical protein